MKNSGSKVLGFESVGLAESLPASMPLQQNTNSADTLLTLGWIMIFLNQSSSIRVLADVAGDCWPITHLSYFGGCNRAWDNVEVGATDGLLNSCIVLLKVWKALAPLSAFLARFSLHHSMKKSSG